MNLLVFLALILGGAVALTLYAALFMKGPGERDEAGEDAAGEAAAFSLRLAEIAAKIAELRRLIEYSESAAGPGPEAVIPRQRSFLAYLLDYEDRYAALFLESSYRSELEALLPLLEEEGWIERFRAFRAHVEQVAEELRARMPSGPHAALDAALEDLRRDLAGLDEALLEAHTGRLIASESPLANAEGLAEANRRSREALASRREELDAAFDRFVAERELLPP